MNKTEIMRENMRNKLRLDTWWGRITFMMLSYLSFWWIFYGVWFLIPYRSFNYIVLNFSKIAPYYLFGLIPVLSLILPYHIRKYIKIHPVWMYILHIIIITSSLFFFFLFAVMTIYKNYTFQSLP